MGTYGCVEILDAVAWKTFVDRAKGPTQSGKVELVIEALAKPVAKLAVSDPDVKRAWSNALYDRWMSPGTHHPVELTEADVDRILARSRTGGVPVKELQELYLIYVNYVMPDAAEQKFRAYIEGHMKRLGL
jgi:hypothetical protein